MNCCKDCNWCLIREGIVSHYRCTCPDLNKRNPVTGEIGETGCSEINKNGDCDRYSYGKSSHNTTLQIIYGVIFTLLLMYIFVWLLWKMVC